jgi:hypothetical protein
MSNIKRIYPESKTALINWIEENFHDIEEFVAVLEMKDGTQMTIYDFYSYRNAMGTLTAAQESINDAMRNDEFIPKRR